MTVTELIDELKKYPKDTIVGMKCGCRVHRAIEDMQIELHEVRVYDPDHFTSKLVPDGEWLILNGE